MTNLNIYAYTVTDPGINKEGKLEKLKVGHTSIQC